VAYRKRYGWFSGSIQFYNITFLLEKKDRYDEYVFIQSFAIGKDSSRYLLHAYVKSLQSDFQKWLRLYRIRTAKVTPGGKKSFSDVSHFLIRMRYRRRSFSSSRSHLTMRPR